MIKLITCKEDFNKAKSKDIIEFECHGCKNSAFLPKGRIVTAINHNINKYCSSKCYYTQKATGKFCPCKRCGKERWIPVHEQNKDRFCSRKCAGITRGKYRRKGNSRSKLELWIEDKLKRIYPNIEILFNNRTIINSELDIYFPSINLAIELNGPFHYEPIYGEETLKRMQNNDKRKFQACLEKGIELCIINTSKQQRLKESNCFPFLKIITNILDEKLKQ